MNKKVYLELEFSSAYLPVNSTFNRNQAGVFGDVTFDNFTTKKGHKSNISKNRVDKTTMIENTNKVADVFAFNQPITQGIIANVLAVLMGERPVSRLRGAEYELNPIAEKLSKNAFIYVDKVVDSAIVRVDKSHNDSSGTLQVPTWKTIEYFIGHDKIEQLRKYLCKYVPNADTEALVNIQSEFTKHIIDIENNSKEIKDICKKSPIGIIGLLCGGKFNGYDNDGNILFKTEKPRGLASVGKNNLPILKNKKGISDFAIYNGSIIVEMNEKDIELFRKGNGVATILDGGSLRIKSIHSDRNSPHYNYRKFKPISDYNHIEISNHTLSKIKEFVDSYHFYLEDFIFKTLGETIEITGKLKDSLIERKNLIPQIPLKKEDSLKRFFERADKAKATVNNNYFTFKIN